MSKKKNNKDKVDYLYNLNKLIADNRSFSWIYGCFLFIYSSVSFYWFMVNTSNPENNLYVVFFSLLLPIIMFNHYFLKREIDVLNYIGHHLFYNSEINRLTKKRFLGMSKQFASFKKSRDLLGIIEFASNLDDNELSYWNETDVFKRIPKRKHNLLSFVVSLYFVVFTVFALFHIWDFDWLIL